jgi:hypothetical protein
MSELDVDERKRQHRAANYADWLINWARMNGDQRLTWHSRILDDALAVPDAEPVDWDAFGRIALSNARDTASRDFSV